MYTSELLLYVVYTPTSPYV